MYSNSYRRLANAVYNKLLQFKENVREIAYCLEIM